MSMLDDIRNLPCLVKLQGSFKSFAHVNLHGLCSVGVSAYLRSQIGKSQ